MKTEFVTNNSIAFLPTTIELLDDNEDDNPVLDLQAYWFEFRNGKRLAVFGDCQVVLNRELLTKADLVSLTTKDAYPLMLRLANHSRVAEDGSYVARLAYRKLGHAKPYSHPDLGKRVRDRWDPALQDMLTYSLPPAKTDGWYSLLKKAPKTA